MYLLAKRASLSASALNQIETSEQCGTIQLNTLKKIAESIECDVVYYFIPKKYPGFVDLIEEKAEIVAKQELAKIDKTMRLEGQGVEEKGLELKITKQSKLSKDWKYLWQ